MIDVLVELIVLCVVGGLLYYLIMMLPISEPFKQIIQVRAIVIAILMVLSFLYTGGGFLPHTGRWR